MHEIPYSVLMMMNAVIPDYGSGTGSGAGGAKKKAMSLFDLASSFDASKGI